MPANYVLLETIDLTQSAASVTFDNIPQTGYTDLVIKASAKASGSLSSSSQYYFLLQLNGVTSNGSNKGLYSNGSIAVSDSAGSASYTRIGWLNDSRSPGNAFNNGDLYFPNYTSSNYKTVSSEVVTEYNETAGFSHLGAALFTTTSAITSISLYSEAGNFAQYSTFSLYGLAALGTTPTIGPKATGGNIVANDGTYWYHAFLTSGAFTPATTLSCDVLVVAGGGGGGGGNTNFGGGGGGGAGGLLGFASQSISTATTVTVGSGGAGGTTAGTAGTVGVDSQCGSLTLVKGGGGGGTYSGTTSGGTGGSGGGASYNGSAGAATSGQGNIGGTGTSSSSYWGGSGGGAGSAATNASGATSSTAGAGTNTNAAYGSFAATASATATGVSGYFAGGGGGGNGLGATGSTGGSGGGGNAGVSGGADGSAGTANSGGGGGGCSILSAAKNGGKGGSGIVIIRYAMA